MDKLARAMHNLLLRLFHDIEQDVPELQGRCWGLKYNNNEVVMFYHPYGCETEKQYGMDQTDKLRDAISRESQDPWNIKSIGEE